MNEEKSSSEFGNVFKSELLEVDGLLAPFQELEKTVVEQFRPAEVMWDNFYEKHVWGPGKGEGGPVRDRSLGLMNALVAFIGEVPLEQGSSFDSLKEDYPELVELEVEFARVDKELLQSLRDSMSKVQAIGSEIHVELVDSVQVLAEDIRSRLDYRQIFQRQFRDSPHDIRNVLENLRPPHLNADQSSWSTFLMYKYWYGDLKKLVESRSSEKDIWLDVPGTLGDAKKSRDKVLSGYEVRDQIWEYNRLYDTYKVWGLGTNGRMDTRDAVGLNMSLYLTRPDGTIEESLDENDYALTALGEMFEEEMSNWKERGVMRRGDYGIPAKEKIIYDHLPLEVEGLEQKEGMYLILKPVDVEAALVGMRRWVELFPGWFIDGIDAISFVNPDDGESIQPQAENGLDLLLEILYLQHGLKDTMFHEVFEHVAQKMSLDDMEGYEKALTTDREVNGVEHITWYVKRTALEKDPKYRKALSKKEDFCDTGAMFILNPYQLYQTAPARYEFMLNFFAAHLPTVGQQEYLTHHREHIRKLEEGTDAKTNGIIRSNTLSHQEQPDDKVLQARVVTVGRAKTITDAEDDTERNVVEVYHPLYLSTS